MWQKVRKIKETWSPCRITGLLIHGSIETAPGAIVNELASHYASVSRSNHYSPTFQITKTKEEARSFISVLPVLKIIIYASLFLNYSLLSPVLKILL